MAAPVVGTLDFQKNEIQNVRVHNNAGAPSSPGIGQIYIETTAGANRLYQWNGTAWVLKATDSDLLGGQTLAQVRDFALTTGQRAALSAISDFDTAVRLSRLDQLAVPTGPVSLNSQKLTNVANATNPADAVNLGQLQAMQSGLDVKASVRGASTANLGTYTATGGTSGRGQLTVMPNTIDGVALGANDRVLLKDQTNGAANGIWVVSTLGTGANGVWDRATDADSDAEVTSGLFTFVTEGTVNGNSGWMLTTDDPIIVGGASGTVLVFAQFSGAGQIIAGAGLTKTGNQLDIGAANGVIVNADSIQVDPAVVARKYITQIGNGAATSIVVNHALANQWVQVEIWENTGSLRKVWGYEVQATDANNVTVVFPVAPANNAYRAVVVG